MALSFSDFLSFFSQAADGQRGRGPNEQARDTAAGDPSGILNHVQTTGAPQVAPQRPQQTPARPKAQGVLSPIIQQGGVGGPVTEAYAGNGVEQGPQQNPPALDLDQYERAPDITRGPPQGPQPLPPEFAQYEQGILSKVGDFLGPNFLGRLGNGLMVAGSQDPVKALTMLRQQEAEEQEAMAKRAAASRPKIVPIQGGAFSLVTFPDGSMQSIPNEAVMDFQREVAAQQRLGKIDYAVLQARITDALKTGQLGDKAELDNAGDKAQTAASVAEMTRIADDLEKTDWATGPVIGWLPKKVRDTLPWTSAGADLQDRLEQQIQKSLRQALGAQYTEKEGIGVLERAFNPRQQEGTNAARIRRALSEVQMVQDNKDAAIEHLKRGGSLATFMAPQAATPQAAGQSQAPQATPKATPGGLPSVSNDADYAKIPSGTRYVSPDGKIRQKP